MHQTRRFTHIGTHFVSCVGYAPHVSIQLQLVSIACRTKAALYRLPASAAVSWHRNNPSTSRSRSRNAASLLQHEELRRVVLYCSTLLPCAVPALSRESTCSTPNLNRLRIHIMGGGGRSLSPCSRIDEFSHHNRIPMPGAFRTTSSFALALLQIHLRCFGRVPIQIMPRWHCKPNHRHTTSPRQSTSSNVPGPFRTSPAPGFLVQHVALPRSPTTCGASCAPPAITSDMEHPLILNGCELLQTVKVMPRCPPLAHLAVSGRKDVADVVASKCHGPRHRCAPENGSELMCQRKVSSCKSGGHFEVEGTSERNHAQGF